MEYKQQKYKEPDWSQKTGEIDIKAWIGEITRVWQDSPIEYQTYYIIKRYVEIESPSPEQRKDFLLWMTNEENEEAKKMALDRLFNEAFHRIAAKDKQSKVKRYINNKKTIER